MHIWMPTLTCIGHALVLIICCAGGLGFIGYIKHTKSHPTVNVACSMASIALITILTKEGFAPYSLGSSLEGVVSNLFYRIRSARRI